MLQGLFSKINRNSDEFKRTGSLFPLVFCFHGVDQIHLNLK